MNDASLLFDVADGVVTLTLTLNRPRTKNALTRELVTDLGDRLEAVGTDPSVRVVVLTGAEGAFCSGADLKVAMADPDAARTAAPALEAYHRVIRAIASIPQPVIAAVDGPAVGFGCDLALACDMRWLSDRAYLQEKFVRIGFGRLLSEIRRLGDDCLHVAVDSLEVVFLYLEVREQFLA